MQLVRISVILLALTAAAAPSVIFAAETTTQEYIFEATKSHRTLLSPERLFDALKKNITIPVPFGEGVEVPTPEKIFQDASPKLKEINRDIREEAGIDFAKFIGWAARVLKTFFAVVIDLMEKVSGALAN